MERTIVKITGGLLSIAKSLITNRPKVTWLPINPANISAGIAWLFHHALKGVNYLLTTVTGFDSNWNTATFLQITGGIIIDANPVRANLTGNNITGSRLNSNFPFSINISTRSRQPDVISNLSDIGCFRHRFP